MPSTDPAVRKAAYARWWAKRKGTPQEKEYQKRHYLKHRDSYIAKSKSQYAAARLDPTYMQECSRRGSEWAKNNRVLHNIHNQKRRATLRQGDLTLAAWNGIVDFYDSRCAYCAAPWEHIDHVVPLVKGGLHSASNVVPACASCNLSKGSLNLKEWLAK